MSDRPTQRHCVADWTGQAEALIRRARAIRDRVPPERLARPPADGGWSAAQVFEHLAIADESYLAMLRKLDPRALPPAGADPVWRPTLGGRMLVWSFRTPRKFRAPRIYLPPAPRPQVIEAFVTGIEELVSLMNALDGAEWRRVGLRSPVTQLIRLNLGDAFSILIHHAERHFGQIDRVLSG
jgi:hypothetical protein